MKAFSKLAVFAAAIAASVPYSSATPISAGQSVSVTTIASSSYTSGILIAADTGAFTASPPVDYVASYTESVYEGGTGAMCPTCLEFVYTVTDTSGSSLESSTVSNFASFADAVDYVSGTGGAPAIVTAVDNVTGTGITVDFGPPSLGNGMSDTFVVFTNSHAYTNANITSQNTVAGNSPDLGPSASAPEPNSLILLGTGLVGGACLLARRRQSA